jgi:protein TonB
MTARLSGVLFLPFAFITLLMVIFMNDSIPELEKVEGETAVIEFDVKRPKPKKKKDPKIVRKSRPPKSSAKPLAPAPSVGLGSFDGVDFGLPEFSFDAVSGVSDDMVGDMDNLLMTEDAVDSKPVAKYTPQLIYPPRARKENVEGRVVLWFIVGVDGLAKDIRVKESRPEGVFDDAAISCISGVRYEPAKYKGRPVEMQVVVPVDFRLN